MERQSVSLYRYGRGLTDPPTPEEGPPSKTGGHERDDRGHATMWGDRKDRQPLVILVRKNGDLCFCMDYRKLNGVIRKDLFPTAPD
jgi:hypothetical protein